MILWRKLKQIIRYFDLPEAKTYDEWLDRQW
jgi:hypothetical protein